MIIPYELHVTVDASNIDIEHFKKICNMAGVKPIILDLEINEQVVLKDVMTSSHIFSESEIPFRQIDMICSDISQHYNIKRIKVETVPWHPSIPKLIIPFGNYFESHIGIHIKNKKEKLILDDIKKRKNLSIHLSKNFFKKNEDESYVLMATLRSQNPYEIFEREVKYTIESLQERFFVEKPIIEYAIFDSNINHDAKWIYNESSMPR